MEQVELNYDGVNSNGNIAFSLAWELVTIRPSAWKTGLEGMNRELRSEVFKNLGIYRKW